MIDDVEAVAIGALKAGGVFEHQPMAGVEPVLIENFLTRVFQRHIVIGGEPVDADDLIAALKKAARHMKADKTCGAGDENPHFWLLPARRSLPNGGLT